MVNKVILVGRLGNDPKIQNFDNGSACTKFRLATNENYKDKTGNWQSLTEWHNIIMWGDMADRAEKQLKKGSMIYLEGKLTSRSYQDQEGNTKYITEVRANTYRSLDKRENTGEMNQPYTPAPSTNNTDNTMLVNTDEADDLPF